MDDEERERGGGWVGVVVRSLGVKRKGKTEKKKRFFSLL